MSLVSVGMADGGLLLTLGMGGGGIAPAPPRIVTIVDQMGGQGSEPFSEFPTPDVCSPDHPEICYTDLLKHDHMLNMRDEQIELLAKQLNIEKERVRYLLLMLKRQEPFYSPRLDEALFIPDTPPMPPSTKIEPAEKEEEFGPVLAGILAGYAMNAKKTEVKQPEPIITVAPGAESMPGIKVIREEAKPEAAKVESTVAIIAKGILVALLVALVVALIAWCIYKKKWALLAGVLISTGIIAALIVKAKK